MAVDNDGNASMYNGSYWTESTPDSPGAGLTAVSCVSSTFCMAVDWNGYAWIYDGSWLSPPLVIPRRWPHRRVVCEQHLLHGSGRLRQRVELHRIVVVAIARRFRRRWSQRRVVCEQHLLHGSGRLGLRVELHRGVVDGIDPRFTRRRSYRRVVCEQHLLYGSGQ